MTSRRLTDAPPMPTSVAEVFKGYPVDVRRRLSEVRALIFEVAEHSEVIGTVSETTKWGEPAYLTEETKVGSTLRIGTPRAHPERWALYFNCNTHLVESFRTHWGTRLEYEGNRALLFDCRDAVPVTLVSVCIEAALTYHLIKQTPAGVLGTLERY